MKRNFFSFISSLPLNEIKYEDGGMDGSRGFNKKKNNNMRVMVLFCFTLFSFYKILYCMYAYRFGNLTIE